MNTTDLAALLHRAAAAIETPADLTAAELSDVAVELCAAADEIVALPERECERMIVLDEKNRQDIAWWTERHNEHVTNGEHLQAERTKWMIDTLRNDPPHRRGSRASG